MNELNPEINRDTKVAKSLRDQHLSKDGKWRSFPKVPNLLQYVSTGTYFARVKVNGKIFRESLETNVFTTAKLKLTDFLKAKLTKKHIEGAPVTFEDAQMLYKQELEADHGLSEQTKRYRRFCLKALATSWPDLKQTKLENISETDCREWASRLAKTVDEQYFNNILGTFRMILKRGGMTRDQDPSRTIKRLGVKRTELVLPGNAQFEGLLKEIETSGAGQAHKCADLVRFLAFSGCRISEARQVLWKDVFLDKGFITVRSAKVRSTSGAAEFRIVPIIPPMRELLTRLKAERSTGSSTDKVCLVGECQKSLNRACKRVGIPRITHHDLRHLFATRCIESGVDIPTVGRWLGHHDNGVLAMQTYGHLRQEHSLSMAQKVNFSAVPVTDTTNQSTAP